MTPDRARRLYRAAGVGVLAAALAYIGFVDPHESGSGYPSCPFRLLTGWSCPACGGLRMTHDLLHGDLAAAVIDNAFLLIGIPMLTGWALVRHHRRRPAVSVPVSVTIAVVAIAWTVLRNMPGFAWAPMVFTG